MKVARREQQLLALLAAVALFLGGRALYRAVSRAPEVLAARPAAGSETEGQATPIAQQKRVLPVEIVELRLDRLEPAPSDFEVGRDLFRFGPPPAPPPPSAEELALRRQRQDERLRERKGDRAVAAGADETAAAMPRPPEIRLRYLGSFGPERGRIAVFTDETGASVLNAKVGEVLAGKFIVHAIGFGSVDLRFVGFEDEKPRRLTAGG